MSYTSRYILALAAMLFAARLDAQTKAPALDADVETTYNLPNGQQFTKRSHLYRSASGKVRQDSGLGTVITDVDKGTVTVLIAEKKEAHVFTIPKAQRAPTRKGRPAALPFEETTIDGHPVVKSRARGPNGETQESWTAKDLGIVTFSRVQSAGLTTTHRLQNVSVREPNPSVFLVPKDYTVVNTPLRLDAGRAAPVGGHPLDRAIMVTPAP